MILVVVLKVHIRVELVPESSQKHRLNMKLDVQVRQTRNITVVRLTKGELDVIITGMLLFLFQGGL